jgi:hypothetical protein
LGLALVGLIIAPGIGILALVALLVLAVCGLSLLGGRAFRRRVRAAKRSAQDFERVPRPRAAGTGDRRFRRVPSRRAER